MNITLSNVLLFGALFFSTHGLLVYTVLAHSSERYIPTIDYSFFFITPLLLLVLLGSVVRNRLVIDSKYVTKLLILFLVLLIVTQAVFHQKLVIILVLSIVAFFYIGIYFGKKMHQYVQYASLTRVLLGICISGLLLFFYILTMGATEFEYGFFKPQVARYLVNRSFYQ